MQLSMTESVVPIYDGLQKLHAMNQNLLVKSCECNARVQCGCNLYLKDS